MHLKLIKRQMCVCSARRDHLLVLWHLEFSASFTCKTFWQRWDCLLKVKEFLNMRWKQTITATLSPCFLEQDDWSGDEEQMGYTINHEKVEVAENVQEGEREKQRRERSEIKPDEINPRIMSALWSSQSARLSSRRACFTLEMKCECFHSNVLRHSSDGPEVILSRWPQCRDDQNL